MGINVPAKPCHVQEEKAGASLGSPVLFSYSLFLCVAAEGDRGISRGEEGGGEDRNPLPPLPTHTKAKLLESWNVENPVFNHFKLFNDGWDAEHARFIIYGKRVKQSAKLHAREKNILW